MVTLQSLNTKGRKMVTIVDPHIKVDSSYHVYQDGSNKGFFVKKADGSEFQVSLSQQALPMPIARPHRVATMQAALRHTPIPNLCVR